MKVYIFRHGETEWNRMGRLQGNVDIPLDEKGRRVAEATARALKEIPFDCAYSSPLSRAIQTAEIILGERNIPIQADERIREIHFGEFEGIDIEEVREKQEYQNIREFFQHPEIYRPVRGAESLEDLVARGRSFLSEEILPKEGKFENILVTSHGAMIKALTTAIRGLDTAHFWGVERKPMKNCGACLLEVKGGQFTILEEGKIFYDPDLFE